MSTAEPILPPGVHVVVISPTLETRDILVKAIAAAGGVSPVQHSVSESADRAHYKPALNKLIINTASQAMHELLGMHRVAVAVEVAARVEAAHKAATVFRQYGYEAKVHTQAEPEFPDGFLTFVSVPALEGILIMFWPLPETLTPDVLAGLPKRVPWNQDEHEPNIETSKH